VPETPRRRRLGYGKLDSSMSKVTLVSDAIEDPFR
jgi:hypothetical protein